jgi:hypothetical protein
VTTETTIIAIPANPYCDGTSNRASAIDVIHVVNIVPTLRRPTQRAPVTTPTLTSSSRAGWFPLSLSTADGGVRARLSRSAADPGFDTCPTPTA